MRIGIVGGGQLGRMIALSGAPLGHTFVVLEPAQEVPASIAAEVIRAPYDDIAALHELVSRVDVVTCEFESVPCIALETLAEHVPVRPGVTAFRTASDRLLEKTLFRSLGIGTAPFAVVDDQASLDAAVLNIGLPAVLKTRHNGYDGKGQRVLRTPEDVAVAFDALGGVPMILEGFVTFRRELSIVAARALDGSMVFYDVCENVHRDGILHTTTVPATALDAETQTTAERFAFAVLERLDYVGVLAIELFEGDEGLFANEMAPRVHNTGHHTIELTQTSQFENHVRAITGMPLGAAVRRSHGIMLNLVGEVPASELILAIPGAHLHLYGKRPKAGRKLGHVTLETGDGDEAAVARLLELAGGSSTTVS